MNQSSRDALGSFQAVHTKPVIVSLEQDGIHKSAEESFAASLMKHSKHHSY
jgi:hypothetical protein